MGHDRTSLMRFWQRVLHEMRLMLSRMSIRKDCKIYTFFLGVFVLILVRQATAIREEMPTTSRGSSSTYTLRQHQISQEKIALSAASRGPEVESDSVYETGVTMLVKRCSMTVSVADVSAATRAVTGIATRFGGYVQTSYTEYRRRPRYCNIVLQVPVDHFDEVRTELTKQFPKLLSEMTSTEDVSTKYIDASARAQSLQATYDQLTKLMQTAEKVSEVVDVQRLLHSVAADLESHKATAKELSTRAAVGRIDLTLQEPKPSDKQSKGRWRPFDTVKAAIRLWTQIAATATDAVVFLTTLLLPVFVLYICASTCRSITGLSRSDAVSESST